MIFVRASFRDFSTVNAHEWKWKFLRGLTHENKTTVKITTQYYTVLGK